MQSVTVILLAIFCALCCAEENAERKLWKNYYKKTLLMGCKDPQKRALSLTLFKENFVPSISDLELEKLLPQSVIVRRCEDSGCCAQKGCECSAIKTKNETIPFLLNKPMRFFYLQIESHELCGCQRTKNHIK